MKRLSKTGSTITAVLAVVLTIGSLHHGATRIVKAIQFDRCCEGYLKRAADANTLKLADQQMDMALHGIRHRYDNHLEGYTSIVWRTPDEDVGFWHDNLSEAKLELEQMLASEQQTSLEISNQLMKLRETLLDDTGEGTKVTVPSGISVFPYNRAWAIYGTIVWVGACLAWIVVFIEEM